MQVPKILRRAIAIGAVLSCTLGAVLTTAPRLPTLPHTPHSLVKARGPYVLETWQDARDLYGIPISTPVVAYEVRCLIDYPNTEPAEFVALWRLPPGHPPAPNGQGKPISYIALPRPAYSSGRGISYGAAGYLQTATGDRLSIGGYAPSQITAMLDSAANHGERMFALRLLCEAVYEATVQRERLGLG